MTVISRPALARTDVAASPVAPPAKGTVSPRLVRRAGVMVTAGALTWAAGLFALGANPETSLGITISDLVAVPFQIGLFALVTAQLRTQATGTTRLSRGILRVEYVLLALATTWSVLHALVPESRDAVWLGILDAFWPLSMLGMFVIAVKLFFAKRWRGLARVWPVVAESWAIVTVPSFAIFGPPIADWVGAGHLLVGYVMLGVILTLRPQLTGARD